MTKWEYEVIDLHTDSIELRKKKLDHLGKDEWELVSVTKNGLTYFKRSIPVSVKFEVEISNTEVVEGSDN